VSASISKAGSRQAYYRPVSKKKVEPVAEPLDVKLMNSVANLLFAVFMTLVAAALMWSLIKNPVFALSAINISGDVAHNNAVTIRANVTPQLAGNFFTLDLSRAQHAFESVPWVRQAVVERKFPNQLLVRLQEHQPVAYWGPATDSRLLNSQGEVFVVNSAEIENTVMPRLRGPDEESKTVLEMYKALSPRFEEMHLALKGLELSGRGSWHAQLDTGVEVELGRGNVAEVGAKVDRLIQTLATVLARFEKRVNALESADLRHDNGYAIRVKGLRTSETLNLKK
jgi:cell division protein FtsQ